MLKVNETFVSINGEGPRSGQLAIFVRFAGCNLRCSYCDTSYSTDIETAQFEDMSVEEVFAIVVSTGIKNVVLTGGEPLTQPRDAMFHLIEKLISEGFQVDIETNGSIALPTRLSAVSGLCFIMDYKLPSSGMESKMELNNFNLLTKYDVVKFVCGSERDLGRAFEIIERYKLDRLVKVYLSSVFGQIEPATIVDKLKEKKMNGPAVQLQIHKIIWDPEMRGV